MLTKIPFLCRVHVLCLVEANIPYPICHKEAFLFSLPAPLLEGIIILHLSSWVYFMYVNGELDITLVSYAV